MRGLGGVGGIFGVALAVFFFVAVPINLYKWVPMAKRAQADYYKQAAIYWKTWTYNNSRPTWMRYPGVELDWQEVIAFDAVRRNQKFDGLTYGMAQAAAAEFFWVQTWEECDPWYDDDGVRHCTWIFHRRYWKKSLNQVMTEHGFTAEEKAWAWTLYSKAYLLVAGEIKCNYDLTLKEWQCTH